MLFTITSSFSNAQSCFTAKCKKYILPTAEHWQSFSFLGLDALMDGDRLLTLDEGGKEGLFTLVPPMGYFAKHVHRCFTPNCYYRLCLSMFCVHIPCFQPVSWGGGGWANLTFIIFKHMFTIFHGWVQRSPVAPCHRWKELQCLQRAFGLHRSFLV